MLKKKKVVVNTTIILGLAGLLFAPTALADSSAELQRIQEERDSIQIDISKADEEIVEIQTEIVEINEQIERVEKAIEDNQKKIDEAEEDIAETEEEIEELEAEIEELQERIDTRFELLKQRASAYQKNGGNGNYLEVILGSTGFNDFIDRMLAVTKIAQADNALIEQLEEDTAELEEVQAEVEDKLEELTAKKVELEGMQAQILEQQEQNETLKEQLEEKEQQSINRRANLEAEDRDLASEEAEIQRQIEASRQADRELAEREAQTTMQTASTPSSRSSAPSSSNSSANNPAASAPASSGSGDISKAITAGNKYIGNSVYVFGGGRSASDIANGRFDCSGFTAWAMSQAGYSIGASTDAQKNAGTQISSSNKQPGDLVFFNTYKTDGHVGIYVGGGKFIGAQSSTGVAIADMSSGYWNEKFNGRVVRVH